MQATRSCFAWWFRGRRGGKDEILRRGLEGLLADCSVSEVVSKLTSVKPASAQCRRGARAFLTSAQALTF